jgi:hypothetical protein
VLPRYNPEDRDNFASDLGRESLRKTQLSRRLDHVAIGSARHHAVLQPASGGKFVRKPNADHKQDNRDDQARDCPAPAVAWVNIWHRRSLSNARRHPAFIHDRRVCVYVPPKSIATLWRRLLVGAVWLIRVQVVRIAALWHCHSAPSAELVTG